MVPYLLLIICLISDFDVFANEPLIKKEITTKEITNKKVSNYQSDLVTAPQWTSFSERSGLWPYAVTSDEWSSWSENTHWFQNLDQVSGVNSRSQGTPGISLRGSGLSDRTLVMINGIPLNLSDGLGPSDVLIPDGMIDRTVVMKGPASVFFGASALGGAINNFVSVRPKMQLQTRVNSWGLATGALSVPYTLNRGDNNLKGQASYLRESDPGAFSYALRSHSLYGHREHNQSQKESATFVHEFKKASWEIVQTGLYGRKWGEYPAYLLSQDPQASSVTSGEFERQGGLLGINITKKWGESDSVSWKGHSATVDQSYDRYQPYSSSTRTTRWSQSLEYSTLIAHQYSAQFFVDQSSDSFHSSYLEGPTINSENIDEGVLFQIPLNSQISVQPAFRYLNTYHRGIGAIGLFESSPEGEKWLSWSQGFRRPSLFDRFCLSTFCLGNPELKPEMGEQWELGFSQAFQWMDQEGKHIRQWQHSFSFFTVEYTNYLSQELRGTQYIKVNRGSTIVFGSEMTGQLNLKPIQLQTSLTYLRAKDQETHLRLNLIPEMMAHTTLKYLLGDRWEWWLRENYLGSYLDQNKLVVGESTDDQIDLGHVVTTDLGVQYKFQQNSISLTYKNLFNQPQELMLGYPEPLGSLWLQASWLM